MGGLREVREGRKVEGVIERARGPLQIEPAKDFRSAVQ